jgi:hypothetical protein
LMHNPYAERRFAQAHDNLDQLIAIFWKKFRRIY